MGAVRGDPRIAGTSGSLREPPIIPHGPPVDDLEFQPADPGAPSARTVAMVFVRARVEPAAYPARKLPERSCLLPGTAWRGSLGGGVGGGGGLGPRWAGHRGRASGSRGSVTSRGRP